MGLRVDIIKVVSIFIAGMQKKRRRRKDLALTKRIPFALWQTVFSLRRRVFWSTLMDPPDVYEGESFHQ